MRRPFVQRTIVLLVFSLAATAGMTGTVCAADPRPGQIIDRLGIERGIWVVIGRDQAPLAVGLARLSKATVYLQLPDWRAAHNACPIVERAGLLGTRIFVGAGRFDRIQLADNLADAVIVALGEPVLPAALKAEIVRVLHPGGRAIGPAGWQLTKPWPEGTDTWSHPYHGPDNNPLSRDQLARAPYLTQFLSEPWYVPMPQVTVAAGGRVFKAFGHIALKRRERPWLNTLLAINGFNGTHLWKRPLKPGFMIHRNTLVATDDTVYLADDESCKLLDAATGRLKGEIKIPKDIDPDGVWKWMALVDGVLYALVGAAEPPDPVIRGTRDQPGWPWNGLGSGYGGPYRWGFGRTLLAIRPADSRVLWSWRSSEPIDSRATCMAAGRIFTYAHQKYLACIDAATGRQIWKTSDPQLLAAIGPHDRAQTARKGFASSSYVKANDVGLFFAGPQRTRLVAVSARDGSLMWQWPEGNFQLVLRDDGLYAMGRMETSKTFDYRTGRVLADLQCYRGNCTRATGSVDSIFTRGYRHTGTMRLDLSDGQPYRIPLMRPACQDGVIVAQGHLYWGPWMCDCNHSLVGIICLAPAGDFAFCQGAKEDERLERAADPGDLQSLAVDDRDWPAYRAGPERLASSKVTVAPTTALQWQFKPQAPGRPTAPVAAGGLVFWSGAAGAVRAADAATGKIAWTTYTGAAVRYPPEVESGRLVVGSGDGWVWCLEAKTGRVLWRFRAAPAERRINVHGRLMSTWPVASGVLAAGGTVYAAAGIASYDGTHLYALDVQTGKIRWQNNTSGWLAGQGGTGVSVQGHLLLHQGKLYLAGGNVVSPAVYDARDGRCLNQLPDPWWKRPAGATERFPSHPTAEMFYRAPRGCELVLVDGQVRAFDQLLYSPPTYMRSRYFGGYLLQAASGDVVVRAAEGRVVRLAGGADRQGRPKGLWESRFFAQPRAIALCQNAVIVAGTAATDSRNQPPAKSSGRAGQQRRAAQPVVATQPPRATSAAEAGRFLVAALDVDNGRVLWRHRLPAEPVDWGLALDRTGRVLVALTDGRLLCLAPKRPAAK